LKQCTNFYLLIFCRSLRFLPFTTLSWGPVTKSLDLLPVKYHVPMDYFPCTKHITISSTFIT
jgi:hypothetical protein